MNAPAQTRQTSPKRDPWEGLTPSAMIELYQSRGVPAELGPWGPRLDLSRPSESAPNGHALVIYDGREGEAAWKKLVSLHPEASIKAPRWSTSGGGRALLLRQPAEGGPLLPCELSACVSVVTSGTVSLPGSVEGSSVLRWKPDAHLGLLEQPSAPQWLVRFTMDEGREEAREVLTRAALPVTPVPDPPTDPNAWEASLVRSGRGVKNTFGNLCKIMRHASEFAGKLRLNTMTQRVEFDGDPLPEEKVGRIRELVEDAPWGGFAPGKDLLFDAIRTVAAERKYHPVQEYLSDLQWDGTSRIDDVIVRVLNVPESAVTPVMRLMVRRWFVGAVRRALEPGVKHDSALVLQGGQGSGKTTFFEVLGGRWFGNTEVKIGDKDGLQQIHANWITEWGEFDHISGARHAGEIKAFVSRQRDDFRPPYGRNVESYPRSCVIVGTVNPESFLNDPTGSRRFHVIRVVQRIDLALLRAWRDQLWAEAVHLHLQGEIHYLDGDDERAREEAAKAHRVRDVWEDMVAVWITEKAADRERAGRRYLQTVDIVTGALGLTARDCTRGVEMRVGDVMRALGYVSKRVRLQASEVRFYGGKDRVHAWLPAGVIATPELDAAAEVVFDGPNHQPPDDGEGEP